MGSGRKSYSAGHFDKRDLKLMSRQSSRSFLTSEWITSLRQKGIIISDAEIRYRRWLALSSPSHHRKKRSSGSKPPPQRPYTAPSLHVPRENKSSKLRQQCLSEPLAEIDHTKLAKQKQSFEKQCRSYMPTTIRMDDAHLQDDLTPYQFLIGSRYNHSNIIDVRSLSRLGVYVPKESVGGAFINPAGILPPTNTQYGRVNDQTSEDCTNAQRSSVLLGIRNEAPPMSLSSSVEGGIDSGNTSDRHSENGSLPSNEQGQPLDDEPQESPSITIEPPSLNETKSTTSVNEGSSPIIIEPTSVNDEAGSTPSINEKATPSVNEGSSPVNEGLQQPPINDDDENLLCSSEATTLTMQILDEELTPAKDKDEDNKDLPLIDKDHTHQDEDGDNHDDDIPSTPPIDNQDVTMVTDTGAGEDGRVSKTNSSIVVDMTKLQISS